MTLKIEILDPQSERPSTLRALAHFLNCLASDADGKPAKQNTVGTLTYEVEVDTSKAEAALNRLEALAGNEPPVAPSASGPSTPPPSADATNVDYGTLDANGLPWDARIHSSSKNQNADGTWRYLRGGDVDQRAAVEAELRAAMGNAASSETPTPPPAVVTTDAGDVPPPPPPPAPAPSADAPPPPPPVAASQTEEGVTKAMVFKRASQISPEHRMEALGLVDLDGMPAFLAACKTDESIVQRLYDAIVAVTGEE